MAADPYQTLGVARDASSDDIRRAFHSLAKKNHPDLHQGDAAAEARFKAANAANDLLSDPEKRARFDRGELGNDGEPRYNAPPGAHGGGFPPGSSPFGNGEGFGDVFAEFLHQQQGGTRRGPRRGRDRLYALTLDFLDAVNGAHRNVTMNGAEVDIRIPPGVENGQTLRLAGKGEPGRNGAPPGDAMVEITVTPHPRFRREGADILIELPISLTEAVLGAKVPVPTTTGSVNLSIPAHAANGTRLRLRGRGVPARAGQAAGDQYAILAIVLDPADEPLARYLRERTDAPAFNPRAE